MALIAVWGATVALGGAFVQVGTGQRVFDLPLTDTIVGGGTRIGFDLGVAVPFIGANVTSARVIDEAEEVEVPGTLWSIAAGLRVDLGGEDRPLQPFLSAGGVVGRGSGGVEFDNGDEQYEVSLSVGPGIFAGAGADAALLPNLWIGLEVGAEVASGDLTVREEFDGDVEVDTFDASGAWTYVDLHLVFRPGGGK